MTKKDIYTTKASDVGEQEEDEDNSGTVVEEEIYYQIRSPVKNLYAFALSILFQIVDRTATFPAWFLFKYVKVIKSSIMHYGAEPHLS